MKKKISIFVVSLSLLFSVTAYEWGGLFSHSARTTAVDVSSLNSFYSRQTESLSLWANAHLFNSADWYVATQGSFKYNYSFTGLNQNGDTSKVLDLDLLKLNGNILIDDLGISLSLGRYIVMDNTTKVFVQNCDGFSFKITKPFINFGVYSGYTGLLNGNTVATLDKTGTVEINLGDMYTKTHPYLPVSVSLDFPSLVLNQAFGMQGLAFIDLGEDRYDRYYATLFLKGPLGGPFYYNFTSCFGTETFGEVFNYSTLSLMLFKRNLAVKLNCEYASGEQWIFKSFRGFNSSLAYNASWSPEYTGLLLPGFDIVASNKIIGFELKGKFVMEMPDENITIKGISGDVKTVINLFSDFALDLGLSIYYDLETSGELNNYSGNMGISISF